MAIPFAPTFAIDRLTRLDMLALAILAGAVYWTGLDYQPRGDAILYSDLVLNARFDDISLHIGYYAIGYLLDRSLGAALGIPIHEIWCLLNLVAGALAAPTAYLVARQLLGGRVAALACTLIFIFCGRVVMNSTTSEVYMPQTAAVLASFLLYARNRTVPAAILGGLALYISPLSAFAYLFFPVFDFLRSGRVRWGHLTSVAAIGLGVYLPYLVLLGDELLWGRRGLLVVNEIAALKPEATIVNLPKYQFKHYTVLLLLAIPAIATWRQNARLYGLCLAVAIPHLYIVLKLTTEDNTFLLNTDLFFAIFLTAGWRALAGSRIGQLAGAALLAGHVAVLVATGQLLHFDRNENYPRELRDIVQRTVVANPRAVIITDWDLSVVLTYFGRTHVQGLVEQDPLHSRMLDFTAPAQRARSLAGHDPIYVLDPWKPSGIAELLRPPESQAKQARKLSIVYRAEQRYALQCTLIDRGTHPLYRCTPRT